MGQNPLIQSLPLSKTWKHARSKNFSNTLSTFSQSNSDAQEPNTEFINEDEITDTSANTTPVYQRNATTPQHTTNTHKKYQEPSLLNISRKRLKLSKSLASPSSSLSNTSSVSLPNPTNQPQKQNKKR